MINLIKHKLEKIYLIRHLLFLYYEIKRAIVFKNVNSLSKSFIFFEMLYLRFFDPYIDLIKKKIFGEKLRTKFENEHSKSVYQKGYCVLPIMDVDQLNFVKININNDQQRSENIVDIKKAFDFVNRVGFNKIVKDYFQENTCNFTATSWNTSPFKKASGITKFHRDRDGYKELKIFIYLNDVNENSGPHVYATNSHRNKNFRFIPQFRYEDEEIKKCYNETIIFCGKKGYCVAEDTTGLHRGTPPKNMTRSILEFVFYTGKIKWDSNTVNIDL